MDKVVIEGVGVIDGAYEFDSSYFTMRELHEIKRLSGLRANELGEAFAAGDGDLIVAIAVVCLRRADKSFREEDLWEAKTGQVRVIFGAADGGDVSPPDMSAPSGSSGVSSEPASGSPENVPSPTGGQPSDTSATSAPETSAT